MDNLTHPTEIQSLQSAAMVAWQAYRDAEAKWEDAAPEHKTDACLAMMDAGAAYTAAWDAYDRAHKDYCYHPERWATEAK